MSFRQYRRLPLRSRTAKTKRLRNIHPGEILPAEFLDPLGSSHYALAKQMRVPITRLAEICARRRAITADTALRLGKFLGTRPKFWLGLQEDFDLVEARRAKGRHLGAIRPFARTG